MDICSWRGYPSLRSPTHSLNQGLVGYLNHCLPCKGELEARQRIFDSIREAIKNVGGLIPTEAFGSWPCGLCFPDSDIDIQVIRPGRQSFTLTSLYRELCPEFTEVKNPGVMDPMFLQLRHKETSLLIDIYIYDEARFDTLQSHNMQASSAFYKENPVLYGVYAIIRSLLKKHNFYAPSGPVDPYLEANSDFREDESDDDNPMQKYYRRPQVQSGRRAVTRSASTRRQRYTSALRPSGKGSGRIGQSSISPSPGLPISTTIPRSDTVMAVEVEKPLGISGYMLSWMIQAFIQHGFSDMGLSPYTPTSMYTIAELVILFMGYYSYVFPYETTFMLIPSEQKREVLYLKKNDNRLYHTLISSKGLEDDIQLVIIEEASKRVISEDTFNFASVQYLFMDILLVLRQHIEGVVTSVSIRDLFGFVDYTEVRRKQLAFIAPKLEKYKYMDHY